MTVLFFSEHFAQRWSAAPRKSAYGMPEGIP